MGEAKTKRRLSEPKRQIFFREHPVCCFCGGTTPATEIDHVPARAIFYDRVGPDGFEFPTCSRCNRRTRLDDSVVTFMSRLSIANEPTPAQVEDFERRLRAFRDYHPNLANGVQSMTPNEVRSWMRQRGVERPDGLLLRDIPIMKLPPAMIMSARAVARKLTLALHYKHTRTIVHPDMRVGVRVLSNEQTRFGNDLPLEYIHRLPYFVEPRRGAKSYRDQFCYRFFAAPEVQFSTFVCLVRQSFTILGFVLPVRRLEQEGQTLDDYFPPFGDDEE